MLTIVHYLLILLSYGEYHRVDRLQGFFSSSPNWGPLTPSPTGEWASSLWFRGGDTLSCGRGSPNLDEGTDTVVL